MTQPRKKHPHNKSKTTAQADAKALRRQEAEERQAKYEKLSLVEKIANLDIKFGKNIGAVKERAKIRLV